MSDQRPPLHPLQLHEDRTPEQLARDGDARNDEGAGLADAVMGLRTPAELFIEILQLRAKLATLKADSAGLIADRDQQWRDQMHALIVARDRMHALTGGSYPDAAITNELHGFCLALNVKMAALAPTNE